MLKAQDLRKVEGPLLLVVPPFFDATRPALGVSQLKANVEMQGVPTEILYLNLDFAERIGLDLYQTISERTMGILLGEVIFSHAVFDRSEEELDLYVTEILTGSAAREAFLLQHFPEKDLLRGLRHLVREANDFCRGAGIDQILARDPWLVGLTSSFQQNCSSLALIRELKRRRPEIVTVMGGANCESEMGEELFARFPQLDFVGQGECDQSFVELVCALRDGKQGDGIRGILSRHGSPPDVPKPLAGEDLDALPHPDFTDFFARLSASPVRDRIRPGLVMETSRGCWWGASQHCTFCGLNGQGLGFRSKCPERVLEEISALVGRYGIDRIEVVDNILDMKYFKSVLPELAKNPVVDFAYEIKANLSRDQVRLLSRSGIRWVQPGIESFSDGSLKLMRKGIRGLENIQLLKWCMEDGVKVYWNYLFGFPGESEEELASIARVIEAIPHLDPPTGAATLHLDRFSPYFEKPEDWGIAPIRPIDAYRHVYPLPDESIRRIAYIFGCDYLDTKAKSAAYSDLQRMVGAWSKAHAGANLVAIARKKSLLVVDTRPCAKRLFRRLEGLARSVYEYCHRVRTEADLIRHFAAEAGEDEIHAILRSFSDDLILLESEGRYLGLAVTASTRYRSYVPFPGGALQEAKRYGKLRRWLGNAMLLRVPPRVVAATALGRLQRARAAATTSALRLLGSRLSARE